MVPDLSRSRDGSFPVTSLWGVYPEHGSVSAQKSAHHGPTLPVRRKAEGRALGTGG